MKSLMVLGTTSNAGKSFIVAGLLRVLKQDGYKVCPFKSQNMALNSYITKDGLEIGRAQAMQALAAGIEPSVYMNPILLKPSSDIGSQVIVHGKVIGNMKAREYFSIKKTLVPKILEAYNELKKEYDICIIEGAGSPAEINLKENDIVNMGLAKLINTDAILVGDIDRGGVFASLYGTIALLEEDEKDKIKGLIINKFRGDKSLLKEAYPMLESKMGKKIVGLVPFESIDIADEDSLSDRLLARSYSQSLDYIDIAVIKLPHISNFTDFDIFSRYENVRLRYVDRLVELNKKDPDILIIPGTKNTIEDFLYLQKNGFDKFIKKRENKKLIIGICGGYQMLGHSINDYKGVEAGIEVKTLGLLDTITVFEEEKETKRVELKLINESALFKNINNKKISAYEIHNGRTKILQISDKNCSYLFEYSNLKKEGRINESSTVIGTYLHGIFDNNEFTYSILKNIADKKNIELNILNDNEEYIEREYDRLADLIRNNIDMKEIYKIIGI